MTPFNDVMSMGVCQVFYLTCLIIDMNKEKEKQVERWQRTH